MSPATIIPFSSERFLRLFRSNKPEAFFPPTTPSVLFRRNMYILHIYKKSFEYISRSFLVSTETKQQHKTQALTGRKAASSLGQGSSSFTDKNLLELFHQQHHRRSPHPCYRKPRVDGPEFVIMHYAGDVRKTGAGARERGGRGDSSAQSGVVTLFIAFAASGVIVRFGSGCFFSGSCFEYWGGVIAQSVSVLI